MFHGDNCNAQRMIVDEISNSILTNPNSIGVALGSQLFHPRGARLLRQCLNSRDRSIAHVHRERGDIFRRGPGDLEVVGHARQALLNPQLLLGVVPGDGSFDLGGLDFPFDGPSLEVVFERLH